MQVGSNNETIITIRPDADKTPRQLRILVLGAVASLLKIDIDEALKKATAPDPSTSTLGQIIEANGSKFAILPEIRNLAESGQAAWVTLCQNHKGYAKKVEASQLSTEVKSKFSNIFSSWTEGSLAIGIGKSFQKLVGLGLISHEEYNPDPNDPGWKRRRYWVEPEQASKCQQISL